ncbi:MAG: TonB-dependent receptor [Phenylobacterium sp.]|nr:MAG: TonB-dependent receptor [Phenylobacterium sp.]
MMRALTSRAPLRALILASSAMAATLAVHPARAADATQLSEIVVTGDLEQTLPAELSRYGNRLDVVSGRAIREGGFVDVGEVLQMRVPGLYLAPQSGPFSYNLASLQGSRPGEILYLVDGVRISNRLYDTTPPLDTIPAHFVERIEVLDGGQGLFFGTQAVAGVVNIVTRDFTDTPRGRLEIGGDTNDSFTASGDLSGAIGGHKLVAFASYDEARGFQPFPDDEYQPSGTDRHRGYRLASGGLKYAYDFSPDLRFSASYIHTEGFVDFSRPTDAQRAVNRRDEDIAMGKLDWTLSDRLQVFLKAYYHNWDSHYDEVDNVAGGGTAHVDDNEFWGFWDYGLNAVAEYKPMAGVETYLGYDLQRYWGRDDVLIIAQQKEVTQAVFAQLRLTPDLLPRTHLALGVRYNDPDEGEAATVWNASGQYDLTDNLFVRATLGTSFRLPDAEELFANDPLNNGEVGNANLRPEKSRNLNASVGGQGGGWRWELIGFARDTRDLIDLSGETPDPDVFTFINLPGTVRARGFEATATGDLTPSVSAQASYTHVSTRQSGSSLQLAGVPKDIAQGVIDVHPAGRGFGGSLSANWVGSVVDNVSSGFGRVEHGHYTVVDLAAWVAFGPADRHRLTLRLENALDEAYASHVSRAFRDADGSPYLLHYLGVPRTLHVAYSYAF